MSADPKIPFGYKQVQGQSQKGDGKWDGTKFRKVRRNCYPYATEGDVVIRKCAVEQTEIPAVCLICGDPEPCSHDFDATYKQLEDIGRRMGTDIITQQLLPCIKDADGNTIVTFPDGTTKTYTPEQLAGQSFRWRPNMPEPAKTCRIFDFEDE